MTADGAERHRRRAERRRRRLGQHRRRHLRHWLPLDHRARRPGGARNLTSDQLLAGGPALSDRRQHRRGRLDRRRHGRVGQHRRHDRRFARRVRARRRRCSIGGAAPITIGNGTSGYSIDHRRRGARARATIRTSTASAIQIGGFNGLAVTTGGVAPGDPFSTVSLPGGIDISGNVTATASGNTSGAGRRDRDRDRQRRQRAAHHRQRLGGRVGA